MSGAPRQKDIQPCKDSHHHVHCSLFRVVRLELGGAEVEEIAGGSEEEEVILLLIGTNTCFKL